MSSRYLEELPFVEGPKKSEDQSAKKPALSEVDISQPTALTKQTSIRLSREHIAAAITTVVIVSLLFFSLKNDSPSTAKTAAFSHVRINNSGSAIDIIGINDSQIGTALPTQSPLKEADTLAINNKIIVYGYSEQINGREGMAASFTNTIDFFNLDGSRLWQFSCLDKTFMGSLDSSLIKISIFKGLEQLTFRSEMVYIEDIGKARFFGN
ncbi:MAG: hypothetical protein AAFP70_07620, partial [Calditrichota bacterium]